MYNSAVTTTAEETAKKRRALLEVLDKKAAPAADFHALQGPLWGRRLKRALVLNVRYLKYLFCRFVIPGSAKARLFWGKKYFWGRPEHSSSMHFYGLLEQPAEVRLTRFLIRTLVDDDVFFDVGANFGFYSLLAAEFIKSGRICSFEPVPYVFEGLARNARSAGKNVRAVESAVSDRVGVLDFDQAPACRHTGSTFDEEGSRVPGAPRFAFKKVKVRSTTLDAFCAQNGLVPTVIKIDVEGAENLVIAGASETLTSASPTVILEVLKPPNNNKNHRDAVLRLRDLGYRPHVLTDEGALRPLDVFALEEEFSSGETANLVFRKPPVGR
jgi:FkbM family methyltransferase